MTFSILIVGAIIATAPNIENVGYVKQKSCERTLETASPFTQSDDSIPHKGCFHAYVSSTGVKSNKKYVPQKVFLFPFPVADPLVLKSPRATGELLTSLFGPRCDPKKRGACYKKDHQGWDVKAPYGQAIPAIDDGVVAKVGPSGNGCGNRIAIQFSNGIVGTYCHLSGYARGLIPGQRVRRGTTVGFVGATGNVTGPHLHLQLEKNGQVVDPFSFAWDFQRS